MNQTRKGDSVASIGASQAVGVPHGVAIKISLQIAAPEKRFEKRFDATFWGRKSRAHQRGERLERILAVRSWHLNLNPPAGFENC